MFINEKKMAIEMTKKFAVAAHKFGTQEYKDLQEVRKDYPSYKEVIVTRKTTAKKDNFKGLTYEYMEKYISSHDEDGKIMAEYQDLRGLSERAKEALAEPCSYLEMRAWFLKTYPAIAKFHEDREKLLAA
ncbi:MAG: hypothetical protein IJE81_03640 [Oscillospiraceae bacterium]|nr:hypothetical protein [Oscillospiraceae bacterium]